MIEVKISYSFSGSHGSHEAPVQRTFAGTYTPNEFGVEQLNVDLNKVFDDFCSNYRNVLDVKIIETAHGYMGDVFDIFRRISTNQMKVKKGTFNKQCKSANGAIEFKFGAAITSN